ncbi:MAG: biosynthetic-type acetolactate synthase large subunit [Nitrososphaerota archaeon]|jgi:acetolactate synthase-1/2/3 large subunit|nr:biosynthetic-type acetolactate synthase large subunit [Nitrososphaerota archaeon]MDG6966316.1 biosynthetic-type acetolactate synthase large subunit [Nitrososphaerota archaeon]MDG6977751.1 biosynthetic-type acetolactate synthase large subunit [Nitrososphaerota archaeon]MDG7005960.1 biosynthetic-type acetolactate synthase large subunit [Nitrososphaerota archaeon]MDG7020583.1 biosynthetic-type acetolactate synthase large subunit [Nitrososphaerota archaeon]
MTQKMSGARATVEALEREKVEYIFGMPGGASLPLYDALWDSKIKHVLVRHEQLAAHMADAYGRVSRKAGVCSATSGPGATNLITGIATAYADSSPVVAITGQVPKAMTGRNAFQETDIVGIATPVTKYALQPLSPAEVPFAVKEAFYLATTGRPGPVLLDLPKDVQQDEAEMTFPDVVNVRSYRPNVPVDPADVERAAQMIVRAERPLLWGGGGVRIADAAQPFAALAELLMAPVITTLQGKGDFPEDHPLSLGPIGMHGRAEANKLVSECDLLVAVGVRFSDRSTGNFGEFAPNAKIIHVDADPTEFNKNKAVDLSILGDANQVMGMLFDSVARQLGKSKDPNSNPWLKRVNEVREEMKGIPAYKDSYADLSGPKVVKRLREILPPEAILTTGVGRHQMWCEIHYRVLRPRTWITSTGLGTMGFGLPAAVGARFAAPNVPVVNFDGDGSFVMTEQALATAVEWNLPVVTVILNDRSLGMVEQWQRLIYDRHFIGIKFPKTPDFVKLAEAYGAHARSVGSLDEFAAAMREGLKVEGPTVIEVPVSPEEDVFPFMPPGKGLKDTVYGTSKEMAVF